jgi:hypothetical protein
MVKQFGVSHNASRQRREMSAMQAPNWRTESRMPVYQRL